MKDMQDNYAVIENCAAAIAQCDGILSAVEIRKQGKRFKILNQKTAQGELANVVEFVNELGWFADARTHRPWIAGHDGTGLMFRCIEIPQVEGDQAQQIIRVQAQASNPFGSDDLQAVWRCHNSGGLTKAMIVAGRKLQMANLAGRLENSGCCRICPTHQAVVQAWRTFFAGDDQQAVIISINDRDSLICVSDHGEMVNAAVIDIGRDDFSRQGTAAVQNFAQDMSSLADLFEVQLMDQARIFLLSDGSPQMRKIVDELARVNLSVQQSLPQLEVLDAEHTDQARLYELRYVLGLCALEIEGRTLDLAKGLWTSTGEKSQPWCSKLKAAAILLLASVLLLIFGSYHVDKQRLAKIEKAFSQNSDNVSIYSLWQKQKLMTALAQNRVNILGLIESINAAGNPSIEIDNFDYKAGRGVVISGVSKSTEDLYKFEQKLQAAKGIYDVKMKTRKISDKKRKGTGFNISFKYGRKTTLGKG